MWHPADLPKGYHAAPRGQAWQPRPAVTRDIAPRAPRGRAAPGRQDAPLIPACKIVEQQHGITTFGPPREPGAGAGIGRDWP